MPSFDAVSRTESAEVDNALAGLRREIETRFDFKGSQCQATREKDEITLLADDQTKLRQMQDLIKIHCTRRSVDARVLDFRTPEKAAGQSLRQKIIVQQGLSQELAKKLVKELKNTKLKVQVAIQGDELRISGKKRDDLQAAIDHLRDLDVKTPLQFVNFRD